MRRCGFASVGLLVSAMLVSVTQVQAQAGSQPINGAQTAAEEQAVHESPSSSEIVQSDLIAEQFDALDRIADKYRRDKARMTGGGWKLRHFYTLLDSPQLTDKDSQEHIAHLEHWIQQRPESITARVALAASLRRWAWVARGNGQAETVTDEGWKMFEARIQRSREVLEGAAKLPVMCPQWYSEMMTVGLAQSWDAKQMRDLFERAVKFEPEYFYYYDQYANNLLPKWNGEPGQAVAFAKESADKLGGEAGDSLYWDIATVFISRSNRDFPVKQMDWQRIQRGAAVLTERNGATRSSKNQLAYMAYRYQDATVTRQQLLLIGEDWAPGVWGQRILFDRARDWCAEQASLAGGAQK